MPDAPDQTKPRRVKKRHLAGLFSGALTALAFVEAGAPLCPLVALVSPRAGEVCQAMTLAAPKVRGALEHGAELAAPMSATARGDSDAGEDGGAR